MIRVFIVDDQALVRAGLAMVIEGQEDMAVSGEAGDGAQALDRLAGSTADVVLMDIRMPVLDGVETTRRLTAQPSAPKVLVLTTFDLDEYAFAALRAGASGFLLKDALAGELCTAIRTVHRGDAVLAPPTTRRLIDHMLADLPAPEPGTDPLTPLTAREREVLLAMARRGVQRRDRRPVVPVRGHRQDPCRAGAGEAGAPRPGPSGHLGVRAAPDPPRPSAASVVILDDDLRPGKIRLR